MTAFLAIAWRVLSWCVPIPLALIAAAWAWVAIDKHSAVRKAVDKAVTELVSGAEIASLKAQLDAEKDISAFERGRAIAFQDASKWFEESRQQAVEDAEKLDAELEALKNQPPPERCEVTDELLRRSR